MKTVLIILLLIAELNLLGQSKLPSFASARKDSVAFIHYFPGKADYILAYSEEGYWWSNIENYKLLVREGNTWTKWTYYKKWKSSNELSTNKRKKKAMYFKKIAVVNPSSAKMLLDSLTLQKFWTLSSDSLSESRGLIISDDINYKFQIETSESRQIIESYAPEYYVKKYPDMIQRIAFLNGKDIFLRWWKRQAYN